MTFFYETADENALKRRVIEGGSCDGCKFAVEDRIHALELGNVI